MDVEASPPREDMIAAAVAGLGLGPAGRLGRLSPDVRRGRIAAALATAAHDAFARQGLEFDGTGADLADLAAQIDLWFAVLDAGAAAARSRSAAAEHLGALIRRRGALRT